jgi:Phage capsid protein
MSVEITTAFVKSYHANVFHLSQQMNSRLAANCRQESQNAESDFWDRIGAVSAQDKVGRHADTTYSDTPHSRRRVTLKDKFYADLVDKEDKIRMLMSPESEYVKAAVMALNRAKDDEFITQALGSAYGGVDGGTAIALPTSQKVAAHDGTTTTGVNLNVRTLRAVAKKFDDNDVDESIKKYMAISSSQKQSLLAQTEITSSDFNTVRALVDGKINEFMGFEFIRIQRLPRSSSNVTYTVTDGTVGAGTGTITAAVSRRCIAWAMDGMLFATAADIQARIDVLPTKHYSTQVYASLHMGATRMEEEKVVEVICSE